MMNKFALEDQDFAFTQWISYLPSLINSISPRIINKPSLNQINSVSFNPRINRFKINAEGFIVPKELFVLTLASLSYLSIDRSMIIVQNQEGINVKNVEHLCELDFPMTIFLNESIPEAYFYFMGILFSNSMSEISASQIEYKIIHLIFQKFEIKYGICYVSFEKEKPVVWNIVPTIPEEILKNDLVLDKISNKIIQC